MFGGTRVEKSAPRVEAYGEVDELNASLGLALSAGLPPAVESVLEGAQAELFVLGAELAAAPGKEQKLGLELLGRHQVSHLEQAIDELQVNLSVLTTFILPGGAPGAAALHMARTICRRAERRVVALAASETLRGEIVAYLNRLGDYLFVAARACNRAAGYEDRAWIPARRQAPAGKEP